MSRIFGVPISALRFGGEGQALILMSPLCSLSPIQKTKEYYLGSMLTLSMSLAYLYGENYS